jgi:hypothetical protein
MGALAARQVLAPNNLLYGTQEYTLTRFYPQMFVACPSHAPGVWSLESEEQLDLICIHLIHFRESDPQFLLVIIDKEAMQNGGIA